jgi:hypothetical protein
MRTPNKLKEVVKQIDTVFKQARKTVLPAAIILDQVQASKLTIGKARSYLHIRTQRERGEDRYFISEWLRGTYPLASALADIEKQSLAHTPAPRNKAASSCLILVENFMTAEGTNYEVKGTEIVNALYDAYGRRTVLKAKRDLGIRSVKRKDGWYWLWPAQEIQDWLENLLVHGPQERDDIYLAAAQKKWSKDSVDFARYKLGHGNIIQYYSPEKGWVWRQV